MSYELNVRCKNCTRFIPLKAARTSSIEVKCTDRKCKEWNTVKVVMLSDMVGHPNSSHVPQNSDKSEEYKKTIEQLQSKLKVMDGRTKEAKQLNAKIEDMQQYIDQLEGIIDGQG